MRGKFTHLFLSLVLGCLLLGCMQSTGEAAERSWIKVRYHLDVPQQTRDNVEHCLDTVADLLSEYKIYLSQPVTVIVSADEEGYIQSLMSYGNTRPEAEIRAKNTSGVSLNNYPIILLKGSDALLKNKQEVFRVLPHEIFHQVQRQWGKLRTVNWIVEGAPELFRIKTLTRAGFGPEALFLAVEQHRILRAKIIPSALQLGSKDYQVFSDLSTKGYPVYPMSTLMLSKLIEDIGFDKIVYFYQLLHYGKDPEKAFESVFRVPMQYFLKDMDHYFSDLRQKFDH